MVAAIGSRGCSSEGSGEAVIVLLERTMLNPKKTLEREALLRRVRELDAEIAQHERNLREGEARLPIEEQLRLNLQRFMKAKTCSASGQRSF